MGERIKTISLFENERYRKRFPQVPSLYEADYFLQFNGYEVYLPSIFNSNERLNIFELSVLRLLELGKFTVEELGDELCLRSQNSSGSFNYDLVKFICRRLSGMGLLDENNQITEEGRAALGKSESASQELSPYLLLVTRDTQEIFPMFFPNKYRKTGELEKPLVRLTFGSTGKARELKGRVIFVKEQMRRPQTLTQNQLRDTLRRFNRARSKKLIVPTSEHIASTFSEPICLHVKAVLQDGNVDYLVVSDGLKHHSEFLREYVERNLKGILLHLKENASKVQAIRAESKDVENKKYPEVREAMKKQSAQGDNVDSRSKAAELEKETVGKLVKAIEWALQYHLRKFPLPDQLSAVLEVNTPTQNAETLRGLADKLRLDAAQHKNFFIGLTSATIGNATSTKNPTLRCWRSTLRPRRATRAPIC